MAAAGVTAGAIDLPTSVREILVARVARLGQPAERVLTAASVIGRDFDLDLLALVTEVSEDDLIDQMEAAATVALVEELPDMAGRYSFCHALIQRSLYSEIGPTRQARLHRTVAECIETLCGGDVTPHVAELAHHWMSATHPINAKAVEYAKRAGELALAALAPDDALRYFDQALQLVVLIRDPDPLLRCDLLLGLGQAQRQAGVPAFRETLLEAAHLAEELGATDRLVRAALDNNRGFTSFMTRVDEERVAVLEAALAALPEENSQERALLMAVLCSELTYADTPARSQSLATEARAIAKRLGDPATTARVIIFTLHGNAGPVGLVERLAEANEAVAIAESIGDPDLLYGAYIHAR